jgi:hypothetical protein
MSTQPFLRHVCSNEEAKPWTRAMGAGGPSMAPKLLGRPLLDPPDGLPYPSVDEEEFP